MDVKTYWQHFKAHHPEITTDHYDAYSFGSSDATADLLAHLVKIGQKPQPLQQSSCMKPMNPFRSLANTISS